MAQPRSARTHARPRQRSQPMIWTLIAILLLAVLAGTLWLPFYNRTTPTVGGWPFFYWYQLLWVPVVALVSWFAYLLSRLARGGSGASAAAAPPAPPLPAPTAAAPPPGAAAGPETGGSTRPRPGPPPPLPKRQPRRTEGQ
jgi:hypothetical protein